MLDFHKSGKTGNDIETNQPITVLPEMLVLVGATCNAAPFIDIKYFKNIVKKSLDSLYYYFYHHHRHLLYAGYLYLYS